MGSTSSSPGEGGDLLEYVFVAATYVDLAAADADWLAVHQQYAALDQLTAFDAVTVGRKKSGEARFGPRPAHDRRPESVGGSLAEGLAAALYPSVRADVPATQLAASEILGAVAGAVSRGLGRDALRDFGEHLDDSSAALIVAAPSALDAPIAESLTRTLSAMTRHAAVDVALIARTAQLIAVRRQSR